MGKYGLGGKILRKEVKEKKESGQMVQCSEERTGRKKLRNRGQKKKAKGGAGYCKSGRHTHIDEHKPNHWGVSA